MDRPEAPTCPSKKARTQFAIHLEPPLAPGAKMADDELRITIFCSFEGVGYQHTCDEFAVRVQHADGSDAAHLFFDEPAPVECYSEIDPEDKTVHARVCTVLLDVNNELQRLKDDEVICACSAKTQSVMQRLEELDLVVVSVRKIVSDQENMRAPIETSRHVSFLFCYGD